MVCIRMKRINKYPHSQRLLFVTEEDYKKVIGDELEKQFSNLFEKYGWKQKG